VIDELLEKCRFPKSASLTCAVSGGADSCALLALAVHSANHVTAIHVDHGLRPNSVNEAEFVAQLAKRFGAAFKAVTVEVEDGPNLEARAREARYGALPADVCTGHTLDDQAETVLLFLLRGAGLTGTSGINEQFRPLLHLRRAETEALCEHLQISPFIDPSNTDKRFLRNRVRSELLPLMDELAGRQVAPLLARTAALARADLEVLGELAAELDPTDAQEIAAAPRALATLALRNWWRVETGNHYPPNLAAIDRMLEVANGPRPRADIGEGWSIARRHQRLRLLGPATSPQATEA
jgi:tRNA(Ile)-lysidine synthase